jgi:hypothetical protein
MIKKKQFFHISQTGGFYTPQKMSLDPGQQARISREPGRHVSARLSVRRKLNQKKKKKEKS